MSKQIKIIGLIVVAQLIFSIYSCTKNTTVLELAPAVTTTVSLAKDLQPILTTNCAKSGCHNGAIAPNLSAGTAYNSLVNGNFVNTASPQSSVVYLWLTGKEAVTMPLGSANNPSNINALMLGWIQQGAKNN
jgi:hypothetical protein